MFHPIGFRGRAVVPSVLFALFAAPAPRVHAQEVHLHDDGTTHVHEGLHFMHPLIAESVSPDTKIRIDHQYFEFPDGDVENSAVLEAEYAFHRSLSIELGLPYSYTATEFGNLSATFKVANYAFEDAGILLGSGVEIGFPTNGTPDEAEPESPTLRRSTVPAPRFDTGGAGVAGTLGTDDWELAPFVNAGFKRGGFELVAWGILGIPFGGHHEEEPLAEGDATEEEEHAEDEGVGLSYSLSALYAVSSRFQALLELDGAGGVNGTAVGQDVANLSPGLRFRPFAGRPLVLGASVGLPLSNEELMDARFKASLFWHF